MERKLHDYFESETMPQDCADRIRENLCKNRSSRRSVPRVLTAAAAVLALVVMLCNVSAVRVGAQELYERLIHTIAPELADRYGEIEEDHVVTFNGFHITNGDATGNELDVWIYEEEHVDFCEVRDGRLYFVANGENIDITELCSPEKAFVYAVADPDGRVAYLAVGGTPENYGQYSYYPCVSDALFDFEVCNFTGDPEPAWVADARNQIRELMD